MQSEILRGNGQEPEPAKTNTEPSGRRSGINTLNGNQDAAGANIPAPLAIVIRRAGMLYRQILRQSDVAIYFARKDGWIEYEVFKVQILRAGQLSGRSYPDRESFSSSSAWGQSGWTFTKNSHHDPLAAAFAKTQTLLKAPLVRERRAKLEQRKKDRSDLMWKPSDLKTN